MSDPAPQMGVEPDLAGRLIGGTILVWAGLCLGVGLPTVAGSWASASGQLSAPLGPSPMLRLYKGIQLGGLALLTLLAVCSPQRRRWLMRLSAPATALVAQALWLTPPTRAVAAPASPYLALEAFKAAWLLVVGFGADPWARRALAARARRSSWVPIAPVRPIADRAWPPFPGA